MVYRIDNRPKKHRGRYTILGIALGIGLTMAGIYLYDTNKQPILDNVNQVKEFAIKQIPKDSPVIAVIGDKSVDKTSIESQTVYNSQVNQPQQNTVDPITLEKQIHEKLNQFRTQNGLKPLNYNDKIALIAREHSQDMIMNDYFDHTSLDGKTFQDRIIENKIACYPAGENIEQNYQSEPNLLDSIMQTWLNSQEHRQNILSGFYSSEGIGVAVQDDNLMITDDFC